MTTFHFASPWMFLLLLLLPLIALWLGRRGKAAAVQYSSLETLKNIGSIRRTHAGAWLTALRLLTLAFLIIALARPQLSTSRSVVEASGIDLVLALDVSGSMRALDLRIGNDRASRLEVVKKVTADFIRHRPDDRIGMVAFATYPYLISPPTLDQDFLFRNLDRVRIDEENASTAIGDGLASATNRLKDLPGRSKVVILLTDGENNAGKLQPATAAEVAKTLGIRVYTIGAGSEGLVPIPQTYPGGAQRIVLQEMPIDEETLQEIAHATGGKYFRATDTASLERIYQEIDRLEKTRAKEFRYATSHEQFIWAMIPLFLLLATELGLSQTRLRRLP
jgi:Ca-activated chloride channel family protein